MVIKNVVKGFVIVLLMMSILSEVNAIVITPPGPISITNTTAETTNFTIFLDKTANVEWYFDGGLSKSDPGVTSSFYYNNSLSAGNWNVSAFAVNASNSTEFAMTTWSWTVITPASTEGSNPLISSVNVANIKDTTADITFTVNQSDAKTYVRYSTDGSLGSESGWKNGTGTSITIPLSTLNKGTTYYYSVFAYNASNESYFSNSTPIQSFITLDPTTPEITNPVNSSLNSSSITIGFDVNQSDAKTSVLYSTCPFAPGAPVWNNNSATSRTIVLNGLTPTTPYCYKINADNATNSSYSSSTIEYTFTTPNSPPQVLASPAPTPETPKVTIGKESVNFTVSFTQIVNITWWKNGAQISGAGGNLITSSYYLESSPSEGTWNISAIGTNANGSAMKTWNWTVRPKTYSTGNRIWDGSKNMGTTYTWSPMSFYAFYYDVDDNVGNESLKIILNSNTNRNVPADQLIYTTVPEEVKFKYNAWGTYKVIGFMADKYFAGYTSSTTIPEVDPISTLNYKQLHKVLMDDKDSHSLRASSTFPLGDGYAVSLKDVGTGRVAMISITKDGGEVDTDVVEVGDTYTYSKKVGTINDLPIIVMHFRTVFMGTTDNMVQIDGIFQISESYTSVNQNNNYGMMEITAVGDSGITMKNENSFTLSSGSTIDIMGNMKFIVANNDSVLRFAPMVKKTGEYEVRGTISNNETESLWTPLSFEGFYYNIDEDIGTESLNITRSGTNIGIDKIEYSTSLAQVSHKYSGLGKYDVIGFMAEKYFAGYEVGAISDKVISTIGKNQLHKVLIDDDTQRVIYAGSTLTLNDGYVIKIKDVNMGAGTASVWLTVLKDGNEVFDDFKEKGQVFIYEKDVGAVKDLPIIALRIDSIFRGKEATAAFVKGTFQISESYKTVKQGDTFDKMKVNAVSTSTITMKNPSAISLAAGSSDTLMGSMRLKVADSTDIRYYPYILVNGSALSANQLAINVPSSMMVKDTISISITSGTGTLQDNAEISFDGNVIGTTNSTGKLDYMLIRAGQHNITATKLGYEKAIKTVTIAEYVDNRLSLVLPEFIDQFIPVQIKVIVSGTGNAITGANITLDGTSIGTTDSSGVLTYTFTNSGKHNLAATRSGYISVQREIEVRMPFTEFKALDINFRPDVVSNGQKVYVWSNITNSGTKEGTLPVALMINDTVVENTNVTLAPGKSGEVNFSHKIELPVGNYSMEILGQKTTLPVKDEPLNLFLVVGVITGLGALTVYFLTSKNLMSVEAIKSKMNMETVNQAVAKTRSSLESLTSKIMKGGGRGGSPPPKFDPFAKFNK